MDENSINVAMYCPFFLPAYGGAELATLNLAENLNKLCSVILYTYNWEKKNNSNYYNVKYTDGFPRKEYFKDITLFRYPITNLPIIKDFSIDLLKDINLCESNIIHIQGATSLFSRLLLLKIIKNKKIILTTHGLQESIDIINKNIFKSLIKYFFKKSLIKLDHIIALSEYDYELLSLLGVDKRKISIIPNGINVDKFKKRKKYVEKNNKKKILCVARFDNNKNYESLIYALNMLKDDMEFEAYFIGNITNIKYFQKIISLIKKYGLENNVKIGTSIDDASLVDCYFSCDLFVLPSKMETFPLVILEAMYVKLPIIATPVGGIPDLIKNGVNGYLVPVDDPKKLYEACLKLLNNERLRKKMGEKNLEIVKEYTWENISIDTYNLYKNIIKTI